MTFVSNTSPLNYLILIQQQEILRDLFGQVLIPEAVRRELSSPAAPAAVRAWIDGPPAWLECRTVASVPSDLESLGPGERESIALALAEKASLVLLDERRARRVAENLGLAVSGMLGVLDRAHRRGLLDLNAALDRLERTTFRASPRLLRELREGATGRP
jgi:predicted nucleic acid-binding protein